MYREREREREETVADSGEDIFNLSSSYFSRVYMKPVHSQLNSIRPVVDPEHELPRLFRPYI